MNELIFRGKDRLSPDWADLALLLMIVTVELVAGRGKFDLGLGPMILLVGGTVALVAGSRLVALRSWVRVGADGVTICRGLGRGRTYPWEQIAWLDVAEFRGRGGTVTRVARIHTTEGRRRWLSTLTNSDLSTSESFDSDVRRVADWWKHSTRADRRVQPEKRLRDRITPMRAGVLGAVVMAAVLAVVAALPDR
ncbi:PH domain-containing protein [Kitasatospora sp. NPDC056783]|uniref:PH domain-containing protein n=1 Tax=Kitasatospora sp. NPDC056783 TaxID=3345943 RepID=UPI0036976C5A